MTEGKIPKKQKLRNAEYYDVTKTYDDLYSASLNNQNFYNLIEIISSPNNILMAYRSIKKNAGSKTAGVDMQTIRHISELKTEKFIELIQNKIRNYKPKDVRRVEIPKSNGKTRSLGIPAITDRIVQQCILQVLEPICEAKFLDCSNGFRPNRSCETAISQCYRLMQLNNLSYVVDIDIKSFFDNVNHGKLLKQMWHLGIRDKNLLCVISKMLKAPIIMPDKSKVFPDKGTPQGGILSPLLSNIVLNELDYWIQSQWENFPTRHKYSGSKNKNGRINKGNKYRAIRETRLKEVFIVRYADDFKLFCPSYKEAKRIFEAVKQWLRVRLSLEVNTEKSKIVNLKEKYTEFLGFKMKLVPKRKRFTVKSHMTDTAIINTCKSSKSYISGIYKPPDRKNEQAAIAKYNAKVVGIHNYFCIATHIAKDCNRISYQLTSAFKRFSKRLKRVGEHKGFIWEKYGKSKQIRFIANQVIAPIGYVKTRKPLDKKSKINKYTPEGRNAIHKNLEVIDTRILTYLACNPIINRSTEYNDNRLALYTAQHGKCAITGRLLDIGEIHCHHKKRHIENRDCYANLVILHSDVHILIHARKDSTIKQYLDILDLTDKQLKKLNEFRLLVENEAITI